MSGLTYAESGVNIDVADQTKKGMAEVVAQGGSRVLNRVGAFASLFDIHFPEMKHPVLVCKTEEPGSKQKLSISHGKVEEICYDMINHLTNDILVMGARPLAVQDAIICGKFEPDVVSRLVRGIAAACRDNGSVLTGGETSEQPNVVEAGTYILTSSIIGVVEKHEIIDGAGIEPGDAVIVLASNGVHTNGYSFLRRMMADDPAIINLQIAGESFMDAILRPHKSYYACLRALFDSPLKNELRGMAHITGGGIAGNLNRILPDGLNAEIDLSLLRVLPIFDFIKKKTNTDDGELLKTFNMGAGMTVVVTAASVDKFIGHFQAYGTEAYILGRIVGSGSKQVSYIGEIKYL